MNKQKLISNKIVDTINHMLYERSEGIKTKYTLLLDNIFNLYKDLYSKLEDKTISITIDADTICKNAIKYKKDMSSCHKDGGLSIDFDNLNNLINYYCFEIMDKYIKIEVLIGE